MSVLVAFSVTPLGTGEDVGALVAEAVRVVRASGLTNRTDAMFTSVEGETWEEVMAVVQAAVEAVQARAPRTSTVIKVDWRDGPVGRLDSKVSVVEHHLAD
ncbi:MTH1187 family thiamine-binding protein [Dactylosporangium sp. NPDC051485]|uniref:MTH1187 family thiamine-binding protein n=1 Tax=Dactylosporangium sp. NPDC051485 TaxID=3154846 RepID=UPI003414E5F3